MTFYHVDGTEIEIIGKPKPCKDTYAIIHNNIISYLGRTHISNNKGKPPSQTELKDHLRSYRAIDLLKRLNNQRYLINRSEFIYMIIDCYDLSDTEQRLLKMYKSKIQLQKWVIQSFQEEYEKQ